MEIFKNVFKNYMSIIVLRILQNSRFPLNSMIFKKVAGKDNYIFQKPLGLKVFGTERKDMYFYDQTEDLSKKYNFKLWSGRPALS